MSEEENPGVILPEKDYVEEGKEKRKSSFWKGILFASIATLVLELFVGIALDAQGNLVHRYAAYMLGILALFVGAFFVRSTWKMFFATPVIVLVSFVLPYFLPQFFSGLMSPFINLLPTLLSIVDSLQNVDPTQAASLQDMATLIQTYGILIDLVFAMFVGSLAAAGLVGFVKIFSNKPGILTIFRFIFSLFYVIVGVIILPYLLVITSGVSQFGMAMAAGTLNLQEAFSQLDNGTLADANPFFQEADRWFAEADQMLEGITSLGAFAILGSAAPDYKVLIDNMLVLINTAVTMTQSVVPMFLGITALNEGMQQSLSVLNAPSSSLGLSALTQQDIDKFEAGIKLVKQGFGNISLAIPIIQEAIQQLSDLNREETLQAVRDQGQNETVVAEQLDLIQGTVNLINSALDVFKVLITDGDQDGPLEEPLVHLLRGALSLTVASEAIGSSTSFEGTTEEFKSIVGNITVVVDTFKDAAFAAFDDTDVLGVDQLVQVKSDISGIFKFIEDSGNIAIAVGQFGITANPALVKMNATMEVMNEAPDFADLTEAQYDALILNFSDPTEGIIVQASQMKIDGENVNAKVDIMSARAANETYGLMSDPAKEFVQVFTEFNMAENGANFFYLSNAFMNILVSAKELKIVKSNVAIIETELSTLEGITFSPNSTAQITTSILTINNTIDIIEGSLNDTVVPALTFASANFSLVKNMPQMANSANAISNNNTVQGDSVLENVEGIQREINIIQAAISPLPSDVATFNALKTTLSTSMAAIGVEIGNINNNLKGVSIAG